MSFITRSRTPRRWVEPTGPAANMPRVDLRGILHRAAKETMAVARATTHAHESFRDRIVVLFVVTVAVDITETTGFHCEIHPNMTATIVVNTAARLEALPWARYTIEEQAHMEQKQRAGRLVKEEE